MSTIQPSQETAFNNALSRSYTDKDGKVFPATLTRADWITLQAMGLQLFSGVDWSRVYPGQIRDSIIVTWLSIQPTEGKKRAFRSPEIACNNAEEWLETADQKQCADLMFGLFEDKFMAEQAGQLEDSGESSSGEELPP